MGEVVQLPHHRTNTARIHRNALAIRPEERKSEQSTELIAGRFLLPFIAFGTWVIGWFSCKKH